MTARKGVIVDRDATLIDVVRDEDTGAISVAFHPSHLKLLPGVIEGLRLLRDAGYALCVASNQPGPAKGQFSAAAVERTNQALVALLGAEGLTIEAFEVCMHHPDGGPGGDPALAQVCQCRKPAPGLLLAAIEHAGLEPAATWMIGDAPSDMLAAKNAGVRAALVFPLNRCELCPLKGGPNVPVDVVGSRFDEVARAIVQSG